MSHADAKAAATVRRIGIERDLADMCWIVGSKGAVAGSGSPQSGVAPAAATFINTLGIHPDHTAARLANWRQQQTRDRHFATFGVHQLLDASALQAERLARETAVLALDRVVDADLQAARAAREQARTVVGGIPVIRDALAIISTNSSEIVPLAAPESVDALLRLATTDDRNPPDLPSGIRNRKMMGRKPHRDDVRSVTAKMLKDDSKVIADHLARNHDQGIAITRTKLGELIAQHFPLAVADDPQVLHKAAAQIDEVADLLLRARDRQSPTSAGSTTRATRSRRPTMPCAASSSSCRCGSRVAMSSRASR